jgi:hypothetical protein
MFKIMENYILLLNVSLFFFFFFFFNPIAMDPNHILKNFNVTHPLLKSVIFYRNRPTCDARRFLRAIIP